MTVKNIVYLLSIFMFIISIFMIKHSKKNNKKDMCTYIILLSVLFIIYQIIDIGYIPNNLYLSIGMEILIYRAISFLSIILFIATIVISIKKKNKLEETSTSKKGRNVILLLSICPVIIFGFSYIREMYYINNSKLVLVCSSGELYSKEYYGYAINENYLKKISIGIDYKTEEFLPEGFEELDFTWSTDKVDIKNNTIIIYSNDKIIYKLNTNTSNINPNIEEIYYKK